MQERAIHSRSVEVSWPATPFELAKSLTRPKHSPGLIPLGRGGGSGARVCSGPDDSPTCCPRHPGCEGDWGEGRRGDPPQGTARRSSAHNSARGSGDPAATWAGPRGREGAAGPSPRRGAQPRRGRGLPGRRRPTPPRRRLATFRFRYNLGGGGAGPGRGRLRHVPALAPLPSRPPRPRSRSRSRSPPAYLPAGTAAAAARVASGRTRHSRAYSLPLLGEARGRRRDATRLASLWRPRRGLGAGQEARGGRG